MKISVITLHTVNNYGSALQTYATQQVLSELGYDVEIVDYWRHDNCGEGAVDKALQSSQMQKYKRIWGLNSFTESLIRIPLRYMLYRKRKPMQEFIHRRVKLTPHPYYSMEDLLLDVPDGDVYMTGSDQVWNSVWNHGIERPYFLDYAPPGKKRIAFSASIGRTEFFPEEVNETVALLKKYHAISVREESAVTLLAQYGIPAQLILDPTLMLNREQWIAIAKRPVESKPYLLIYQLNENRDMDDYAVRLAKRKQWHIIRIGFSLPQKQPYGKCVISPSVEKLLGYIENAQCVLTDSFHATAFSLNLGTDFISILPPRFGTRIESILRLTDTNHRLLRDYRDLYVIDTKIDKKRVNEILDLERKKGIIFLKQAVES